MVADVVVTPRFDFKIERLIVLQVEVEGLHPCVSSRDHHRESNESINLRMSDARWRDD
jgi:hypothetical protein